MSEHLTGVCRYCGQVVEVEGNFKDQDEADAAAAEACNCTDAKVERKVLEQIKDARDRVDQLFGEEAEELGFRPIVECGPVELLNTAVELIARRRISSMAVQIRGQCKAKVSFTAKGKIKVERSETRSSALEAGEGLS